MNKFRKNMKAWMISAFVAGVMGFSMQAAAEVASFEARYLNEWMFDLDPAGYTLSEAQNTGTNGVPFSEDLVQITQTDGAGALVVSNQVAGAGDLWTDGAILTANVQDSVLNEIRYLRYDIEYDMTAASNDSGTVLGLFFSDGTGNNLAGFALKYDVGTGEIPPAGVSESNLVAGLELTGHLSAVAKVNLSNHTMTVWYDLSGGNVFTEGSPNATSDINLSSIDDLQFRATGDFIASTHDAVVVDNIRTAATWQEIVKKPLDMDGPPLLSVSVSDSANGAMEQGETNVVTVIISNSGGPASNVYSTLTLDGAASAFTITTNDPSVILLGPGASTTRTYLLTANAEGNFLFAAQAFSAETNSVATNFSVTVGSKISYLSNDIVEVSGGLIDGKYEPGETLDISVFSINDGGRTVSNIVNSLSADPAYFSISNLTSTIYSSMAVGDVTFTVYRVEISPDTPPGSCTFDVLNQSGARIWPSSFLIDVFSQSIPSISTNALSFQVTEGYTQQKQIVVSNAGNATLNFTINDNAAWETLSTADTDATPSTQLSGGTAIPLNDPNTNNIYMNAADSGESDTIDIGFDFPFYGTTYSKLYIDSNGAILFSPVDLVDNTSMADDDTGDLPLGNRPLIAPFRDKQLEISDGSPVHYSLKSNPTRLVIVHTGAALSAYPADGTDLQFQTELFADGQIKFSYYNINGSELDLVAVGIQGSTNEYMNIDMIPASDTAVLINSAADAWVSYAPTHGAVPPFGSTNITFDADATSQVDGTANAFTTTFNWGDIGSDDVTVDASVVATVPVLETPATVLFEGPAGEITTTMLSLTNSGNAELNFTITDTGSASASYQGAVSNGVIWTDISDEDPLPMLNPDPNPYINAENEGFSALQPIGFEFPFFGGLYTNFSAGVNGGLSLGATSRMWAVEDFAAEGDNVPQQFIAPYWGNLLLDGNASIRFQSMADQLVVTWENMEPSGVTPGTDLTFQAVLHASGLIEFRYQQINGFSWRFTPWGIRSGTAQSTSGLLILPGDEVITVDEYGYPKTNYVDAISNRFISMTSSNYPIITYIPSQGTIPPHGGTATVELRGNASGMIPSGPNSVTNEATLNIAYEAGVNDVDVTFVVTNSVEAGPVSPLAAALADVDGDGMGYDAEVIAGTDPLSADSVFTVTTDAGRVVSWTAQEGRTYMVWYTLDLNDQFVPLADAVGLAAGPVTDTEHADAPVIFYKVSVD